MWIFTLIQLESTLYTIRFLAKLEFATRITNKIGPYAWMSFADEFAVI